MKLVKENYVYLFVSQYYSAEKCCNRSAEVEEKIILKCNCKVFSILIVFKKMKHATH